MTHAFAGLSNLFGTTPPSLIELGLMVGVAAALTVLIHSIVPHWTGED